MTLLKLHDALKFDPYSNYKRNTTYEILGANYQFENYISPFLLR